MELDPCLTPALDTTDLTYSTDGNAKLLSGVIRRYSQPELVYTYLGKHKFSTVLDALERLLTVTFSTCTEGLAEAYNRKITLMPMPITIPSSSLKKRQERKVAQAGIKSVSGEKTR